MPAAPVPPSSSPAQHEGVLGEATPGVGGGGRSGRAGEPRCLTWTPDTSFLAWCRRSVTTLVPTRNRQTEVSRQHSARHRAELPATTSLSSYDRRRTSASMQPVEPISSRAPFCAHFAIALVTLSSVSCPEAGRVSYGAMSRHTGMYRTHRDRQWAHTLSADFLTSVFIFFSALVDDTSPTASSETHRRLRRPRVRRRSWVQW